MVQSRHAQRYPACTINSTWNIEQARESASWRIVGDVPPQFRSDWSADCFVGSAAIIVVSEAEPMTGLGEE
jgi:hypothetical protein